jgi:hypothetical protein
MERKDSKKCTSYWVCLLDTAPFYLFLIAVCILFFIFGCSTTEDREMMEYEHNGVYECVMLVSGKAYCR